MFFLSDLDPNARVKGARDPLGTQSVWSGFGRLVVGNLTTQTSSLNDFRVLLIGAWLADRAAEHSVPASTVFVAWEQLASYARASVRQESGFRGVTRVQRNLARREPIGVSSHRGHQTLTNQAAYGIWGLYTAAASRCGMISPNRPFLNSDRARSLIDDHYVPILSTAWGQGARELLRWVVQGEDLRSWTQAHRTKLEAIADCICDPLTEDERSYFRAAIVEGGDPEQPGTAPRDVRRRQALLAPMLRERAGGYAVGRSDVMSIAASTQDEDLAEHLEAILACETLLAPAIALFSYLSQQPGESLVEATEALERHFQEAPTLLDPNSLRRLTHLHGLRPHLLNTLPDEAGGGADRWLQIARALHNKDFEAIVSLLLKQNELVSRDRGGAVGWIAITPGRKIDVRLPGPRLALPEPTAIGELWINGYFLTNLLTISRAVEAL